MPPHNKKYLDDTRLYFTTIVLYTFSLIGYAIWEHWSLMIFPALTVFVTVIWTFATVAAAATFITDEYPSEHSIITSVPIYIRWMIALGIALLWTQIGLLWIGIVMFFCQSYNAGLYAFKRRYHKEMKWLS